jgi:hypothetical protein
MNNKSNAPRPRKPSTFDRYVAERSAHIEKIIEHTLRAVDATKYSNLTDYCKAVANVVSEIRAAKAGDPNSPFFNKAIRPFSYVTLLRNESYRRLVEGMFDHSRVKLETPEIISEDALLKIASLHAQVNLLKDRLSSVKTGSNSNALADAGAQENIAKLRDFLAVTIQVYTKMREDFLGLLKMVTTPTEKYKITGLHSSYGLVADVETLQKIEEGRKFLEHLSKAMAPVD